MRLELLRRGAIERRLWLVMKGWISFGNGEGVRRYEGGLRIIILQMKLGG